SQEIARITADPYQASDQAAGRVRVNSAAHLDAAAAHAEGEVGARVTFDANQPVLHAGADPVQARAVALDQDARPDGSPNAEPFAHLHAAPPISGGQTREPEWFDVRGAVGPDRKSTRLKSSQHISPNAGASSINKIT